MSESKSNNDARAAFVETAIKDDSKHQTIVSLSIGRENVFTPEFIKYLNRASSHILAREIGNTVKNNPKTFMDDHVVEQMVSKTKSDILKEVGKEVLDALHYMISSRDRKESAKIVFDAMDIISGGQMPCEEGEE